MDIKAAVSGFMDLRNIQTIYLEVFDLKKVLGAMIGMFVFVVLLGGVWTLIFQPIIGGSSPELSFIYPIYAGLIILAGIVVGCSVILYDEIEKLREEMKNRNIQDSKENIHTSDSENYIDKES